MATLLPRWNLSLRTELIACLLVTSLASTAIVGGLAYQRLTKKFNALVMQESSKTSRPMCRNTSRPMAAGRRARRWRASALFPSGTALLHGPMQGVVYCHRRQTPAL